MDQQQHRFVEEYMLNATEVAEILGFSLATAPLKAIHQFIECNSEFGVESDEVKHLLAHLRCSEHQLADEQSLSRLFLPEKTPRQQTSPERTLRNSTETDVIHSNYHKTYLGRNDLISSPKKLAFLGYVHPNSALPQPSPPAPRSQIH